MRYFEKQLDSAQLTIFNQWKAENSEKIQEWMGNGDKTGDNLWGELGKTFGEEKETEIEPKILKNALEKALFEEQSGLCCYCGNAIERNKDRETGNWVYRHKAIEHFEPKNKFKAKTFDTENLMLCCKESQKLKFYEVGRINDGVLIRGFENVAILTGLSISTIKAYDKNSEISQRSLRNGDKIYVPNPPHCDDEKSKYDSQTAHTTIINPTKDRELIEKLIFLENGRIDYVNRETETDKVIENTFKVLKLNCDTLIERRQEKWLNAYINYNDVILPYWIEGIGEMGLEDETAAKSILTNNVNKLIEGKAIPSEDGLLEPFYFVEIAFLQSLSNAKL